MKDRHISRHPLVILLVGGLLTSMIIPTVSWFISKSVLNEETRRAKSVRLFEFSTKVNRQLNDVATALELFEYDVLADSAVEEIFAEEQKELRKQVRGLYSEFNGTAWWGLQNIAAEARIMQLLPRPKLEALQERADEYNTNLVEATTQLTVVWNVYAGSRQLPAPESRRLMQAIKPELRKIQDKRAAIVGRAGELFKQ